MTSFPTSSLSPAQQAALSELETVFSLDKTIMQKTLDRFLFEFNEGLTKIATNEDEDTFLPMIPTFIHAVPDGTEVGDFLALDLGGTNLRVCSVTLNGDKTFKLVSQKYKVSEALKRGSAEALFDYIAESVQTFLFKHDHLSIHASSDGRSNHNKLYLGFTFSFPVNQTALNSGTLLSWTKGFEATGAKGNDVAKLLQDALDRKNINVYVAALVNDTVGTMLSRAYQAGGAQMGAIFGTGTNAAYLEKMENLKTLSEVRQAKLIQSMCVNTEWGAFDNTVSVLDSVFQLRLLTNSSKQKRSVLRFTPYDNKLDRESINPRKQAFEKMVSGMYLGEICRNVLLSLIDRSLLFQGHSSIKLNSHYGLDTALMSTIEQSIVSLNTTEQELSHIKDVLIQDLSINPKLINFADLLLIYRVSELVGTRAARLAAVAIAAVYTQLGKPTSFSVGADGSLVEFYPRFEERVRFALQELLGAEDEKRVQLGLAKDGSGVGAALSALQAKKQDELGVETKQY